MAETFFAIIIFLIIVVFLTMFKVLSNINYYRNNWEKYKCHPAVIPLAGLIKKPKKMSEYQFTMNNMENCFSSEVQELAKEIQVDIEDGISDAEKDVEDIEKEMSGINGIFNGLFKNLGASYEYIINMLANSLAPYTSVFAKLKAVTHKITVQLYVFVYFMLTSIMAIRSFLGSFADFIVAFLKLLAIAIATTGFFDPVIGATDALLYTAILIPFEKVISALKSLNIPHKKPKKLRRHHHHHGSCFSPETLINNIKIKDLKPGDTIGNNNYVTAVFKCASIDDMYLLDGFNVTAYHKVIFNNKIINVEDHPHAVKIIYQKPYVYCINTSQNYIQINNTTLLDWEDFYDKKTNTINKTKKYDKNIIWGLERNTLVKMVDGSFKKITDVIVNDILFNNVKVLGTVLIEKKPLFQHIISDNKCFNGSQTVKSVGDVVKFRHNMFKIDNLYNIITDLNKFYINDDILIYDYEYE